MQPIDLERFVRAQSETYDDALAEVTAGQKTSHWMWYIFPQFAGLGTSGTFVGTSRRLRELNRSVTLVSVQPASPLHGLEGLKHMASAIVPGIYDPALADVDLGVSTEDAYVMTKRLAREEGLLVGISSGANLVGAMRVLEDSRGRNGAAVAVIIFPDGGERYLSERFWSDPE